MVKWFKVTRKIRDGGTARWDVSYMGSDYYDAEGLEVSIRGEDHLGFWGENITNVEVEEVDMPPREVIEDWLKGARRELNRAAENISMYETMLARL